MFRWDDIGVVGLILYCEINNYSYCSLDAISYNAKIEYVMLKNAIKKFNGNEVWNHVIRGEIIKFKNIEDTEKCCEYLNSLLIMNKLIGR